MAEIITIRENGFRSSQWRVSIREANRLFWPVGVCMKMKGTKYLHFHVSCKLKTDATLRVACSTIVIQCNTRIFTLQLAFALRHLVLIGSVSQRGKKVDPGVICTFQYRFTPYSNLHHLHKKNYAGPCCKQQASLFPADTTARRKEKSGQTRLLKGLGKQCISGPCSQCITISFGNALNCVFTTYSKLHINTCPKA